VTNELADGTVTRQSRRVTIELVVTDLDGTLWETPGTIHPTTVPAVHELERRGIPLMVATGRRLASTREPLAKLGLAPPVVVLNGALAVDLDTGERIHRHGFTTERARQVLDTFEGAGISPCVYVDDEEVHVFVGPDPSTHPLHLESFGEWVQTADLHQIVADLPILAFAVLAVTPGSVELLEEPLRALANPHVSSERQYGGGLTVTVAPPGQSKWDGVAAFCEHKGLDVTKVLAMGDGPNDLELLDGASVAVVMADGHPDALARADHVLPRSVDGGWAGVLDLI
jgi:Cof subfamily protein (haloacid dehalogenase superfamily)